MFVTFEVSTLLKSIDSREYIYENSPELSSGNTTPFSNVRLSAFGQRPALISTVLYCVPFITALPGTVISLSFPE